MWLFPADHRLIVSAGLSDRTVRLWDRASGKPVDDSDRSKTSKNATKTLSGHQSEVNAVAFCPVGKWLASAGQDGQIVVWDSSTGEKERCAM